MRTQPGNRRSRSAWREAAGRFYGADVLVIAFVVALSLLALAFAPRIPMWPGVVASSTGIIAALTLVATAHRRSTRPAVRVLHEWAFLPIVYVVYLTTYWVIGPIRGGWVADDALISLDAAVFGSDPIAWLARIAHPWLTEVAQVAYTLFYPLVIVVAAEIYARRPRAEFHRFDFACACGFLASYVGYLLVPAVGPRFTLYDFASIERDLPGLLLTPVLREFVNLGGLVPSDVSRAVAVATAHRDAFPSGHTLMTLVSIGWCWRLRLCLRWPVTIVGAVLIFATVYLRYHYVVDVIAGAACAAAVIGFGPAAHRWLTGTLRTRDRQAEGEAGAGAGVTAGIAR